MRELWTVFFSTESGRTPPAQKSYSLVLLAMLSETDEQIPAELSRKIACGFSACPTQETAVLASRCNSSGNSIGIAAGEPNEAR